MATISVIALWDSVQTEQGGFTAGTVSVSIPGPNVVSSNTAVSGFTAYYLLRVSPDGTHVDHVDPATLGIGGTSPVLSVNGKSGAVVLTAADVGADASGAASTSMAAHVAALDPHPQYALDSDLSAYAPFSHTHAASAITSGTLADARLSSNVAKYNSAGVFVTVQTITSTTTAGLVINAKSGFNPIEVYKDAAVFGAGIGMKVAPDGALTAASYESPGGYRITAFGAYIGVLGNNRIEFPSTGLDAYVAASGNSFRIHGESGQTADLLQLLLPSSTGTRRAVYGLLSTWTTATDATRKGQLTEEVYDTAARKARRIYTDGTRAYTANAVHTTAPADADLQASEFAIYTDGTGLFAKLKNAASAIFTIPFSGSGWGGTTTFVGPTNYPAASPSGWWVSPRDFGGYGDGVHDDTAAIIAALAAANGNTVRLPAGDYLLSSGQITLPPDVSLEGTYNGTISHPGYRDGPPLPTKGGSRFLIDQTTVSPFRTNHNAYIRGFSFFDTTQTQTTTPVSRPPAILVRGVNSGVISVELLNIYWGVSVENTDGTEAGLTQRSKIWDLTGQPLYRGITMGLGNENAGGSYTGLLDVPEIKFMFNPWWSYPQPGTPMATSPAQFNWMLSNAVAVDVGDVDEAYFFNCFAFGYGIGARFQTFNRGAYGAWTNGGFDTCTRCVQVLGTNYPGIAFNGTSFGEPSGVTNGGIAVSGGVVLVNGGRFFNQNPAAVITGGATSLTGCNFGTAGGTHVAQSGGSVNVVGGMAKGGLTTSGTVSNTGVMGY